MSIMDLVNDGDVVNTDTGTEGSKPESGSEPSWWLDENTAGQGERPAWLPNKFKSVSDVVKGYTELEKRLGTSPEEYDMSKGSKYFDPDYESFQDFAAYAKEKRVPQDVVDKMFDSFSKYMSEFDVDMNEEREALGENYKERLNVLNNWAKSNLSEDSYYALVGSMRSADAVKAIEELRGKLLGEATMVPNGNEGTVSTSYNVDELQNEIANNFDKYQNDLSYRNELLKKIEIASKHTDKYKDKTFL